MERERYGNERITVFKNYLIVLRNCKNLLKNAPSSDPFEHDMFDLGLIGFETIFLFFIQIVKKNGFSGNRK